MLDKEIYRKRADNRLTLGQEVTITFADGNTQWAIFNGLYQDDHGTLNAVVSTDVDNPCRLSLVHFSRIKELIADEEKVHSGTKEASRMWSMMHKHLEGVLNAMQKKDEGAAFRIAADAVSCLFNCIRMTKDGK